MGKVLCEEVTCDYHSGDHCAILASVDEGSDETMPSECSLYHNRCFYCYHECNEDCEHPEKYNEDYDDLEEDEDDSV